MAVFVSVNVNYLSVNVTVGQWHVLLYPTNTLSEMNVIQIPIMVHTTTSPPASPRVMHFGIENGHISLCTPNFTPIFQLWHIKLLVASFIYLCMFLPMRNALKYTFKFSSILSEMLFRFYFIFCCCC